MTKKPQPPKRRSFEALSLRVFKPKIINDKREKVKHKKKIETGLQRYWDIEL